MRRKLVWLLLSGLVAALLVTSCAPGATKEKEAALPEEEAVGEEKEPGTFLGPFKVGETAQTDTLAVTVTAIWLTDSYDYYSRSLDKTITRPSGSDTAYLFANIKIKNLDSVRSYDVPPTPYRGATSGPLIIRGGYTGGWHQTGSDFNEEGRLPFLGMKLLPGEEMEGRALFIIPSGQTGHFVEYRLQINPSTWARWLME